MSRPIWFPACAVALVTALRFTAPAAAQTAAPPLTIGDAVARALKDYPSIRISLEQRQAAAAGVRLARTAYLPRIDTVAQIDRATRNNVFGMTLPQTALPALSGPVLGTNNLGTAWGSAAGGTVWWEPFDFGLRAANAAVAEAANATAEAAVHRARWEVSVGAADAWLTVVAADETERAAQAGVERATVLRRTIAALVGSQLRPGADLSRAEAELAAARTQVIQAGQAAQVARATLAQYTGLDPATLRLDAAPVLRLPPDRPSPTFDTTANPAAAEQHAVVAEAVARLHALEHQWFPKFALQAAAYARGSGAEVNGKNLGGLNGLAPTTQNYAVGFSVTFPLMEGPAQRAREAVQSATVRGQEAKAAQIALELRAQWNRAVAGYNGARSVAANTPSEVTAAREASNAASARYRAGLSSVTEAAEADRLLVQAEIDDALARLAVWRSLLAIAAAAGDVEPFLAEVSR